MGFPPPRASRREAAALSWAHADQPKTYASSLSTDQGKESAHISQGRASGLGEPRAGQRPQRPAHDTVAGNVPAHSPEQRSGGAGRHSHAQGVVWCTTVFGAAALIVGPAPRRIPKRQPTVCAAARADPSTEGDKKLETIQWIALDTRPRGRSRSPAQPMPWASSGRPPTTRHGAPLAPSGARISDAAPSGRCMNPQTFSRIPSCAPLLHELCSSCGFHALSLHRCRRANTCFVA